MYVSGIVSSLLSKGIGRGVAKIASKGVSRIATRAASQSIAKGAGGLVSSAFQSALPTAISLLTQPKPEAAQTQSQTPMAPLPPAVQEIIAPTLTPQALQPAAPVSFFGGVPPYVWAAAIVGAALLFRRAK